MALFSIWMSKYWLYTHCVKTKVVVDHFQKPPLCLWPFWLPSEINFPFWCYLPKVLYIFYLFEKRIWLHNKKRTVFSDFFNAEIINIKVGAKIVTYNGCDLHVCAALIRIKTINPTALVSILVFKYIVKMFKFDFGAKIVTFMLFFWSKISDL